MMKTNKWFMMITLAALLSANANAKVIESSVATVNGKPVLSSEYEAFYNGVIEQYQAAAPQAIRSQSVTFMPGEFLPEIEVIAANSSVGSVQGFIKTAFGFHIIMKTGEKRLSKEEAAPRIRAVLEKKRLDKILESLQSKYEVVIYDKNE